LSGILCGYEVALIRKMREGLNIES
jgi:hypothetical protein